MNFRHFLSWKPLFYDTLLPTLRRLGPSRGDAALAALGRISAAWPPRRRELADALARVRDALDADWDLPETLPRLGAGVPRFLARDYFLDGTTDEQFFARFDVRGAEHLDAALAAGRGAIVVGCHLGNHLAAMHWMCRRGIPLRLLIQYVRHRSRYLRGRFDVADGPHPQAGFFLRRDLSPEVASQRVFRTRAALRDGLAVYLKGDVPWFGANTRPGRFLGVERPFQSLWAEFAAVFRAPAVPVFCTAAPGGRLSLVFDPPLEVARGGEAAAVAGYLARLEEEIRAHPADAVAHLLWNCYGPATDPESALSKRRPPSRRRCPRQIQPTPVA